MVKKIALIFSALQVLPTRWMQWHLLALLLGKCFVNLCVYLYLTYIFICRYAKNPALLGIELLNEPSAATVSLDVLISYYKQGYQIVRKYSSSAYVIICQRIGVADPMELYQANIGSHNLVLDLHFYNLFDTFFNNMSAMDNIQYIYKSRVGQLQALNNSNGPLVLVGKTGIYSYCLFDTALDVSPL